MIVNVLLLLAGIAFLIYGIKTKTKFFIIAGFVLIGLGLISTGIDFATGGTGAVDNHRLPFVINNLMR